MRLTFADALHFGCGKRVNLRSALTAILTMHAVGQMQRPLEQRLELFLAFDPAADVADDATELRLQRAQRLVRALELMGVRIALMLDQSIFADAHIGLAERDPVRPGEPD